MAGNDSYDALGYQKTDKQKTRLTDIIYKDKLTEKQTHRQTWQTGAKLNDPSYGGDSEELAPWRSADPICFYPRPFDSRVPNWGKHFVAYVRGAHGIDDLP